MLQDHPRRCGENSRSFFASTVILGSPPQVRGKPGYNLLAESAFRITPAGAGKTAAVKLKACIQQDHPRRCGENASRSAAAQSRAGSPPQVRGKLTPAAVDQYGNGITPAGAGKTDFFVKSHVIVEGSPPQVRGKHRSFQPQRRRRRITPAGAGKTPNISPLKRKLGDHPRRCGENYTFAKRYAKSTGSPPQVRGKLMFSILSPRIAWITPAGAGKTSTAIVKVPRGWDHPRRCGENLC